MKLLQLLTFTSTALAIATQTNVNYDGYQVFRLKADEHNIGKINDIVSSLNLETWKSSAKIGIADIVIPPHQVENFLRTTEDFQRQVMHTDLGASIAEESQFHEYSAEAALAPNATWFTSYHTYATHLQFLRDLVTAYPSNAEIVTSGNSNAGNPITGIHIYGSGGKGSKPAVLFHGTVHAREWITTMVKMLELNEVTEYVAYNLLSNYATSSEIKGFVDKYDYYIFPVVNPDGRDINRNWAYQWATGGSSTNPCDETFRGAAAADATETKGLAAFATSLKKGAGLKLFIDFHSYSQLFMTPYGYSCTALAENNSVLQSLAKGFVTALKAVYGTSFTYGPICSTIYQASGNSVDYLDATVGADYSFTTELRDTGTYGFVLPASQITPSAVEAFAGVRSLLLNMP
ncbi:Zinc carboxypeptidase protein [Rutstroemia sp. NJR-2017a WRK4]|nr:Zinc carboxypeptidase protein [Rutstroemia sp. NJR-2017a WRK4]